jgi:hypothetical protein
VVKPPYSAIPWLILAYVVISCLIYTENGPFTGHIVGFDDQSRMAQVMQWINGSGWYDRFIARVNPPDGFHTIWARIVDIPIAAVTIAASLLMDQHTAALTASVIVPFTELYLMFLTARYFARPLCGKNEAWLVIFFVMFTTVLNHRQFTLAGFHIGEASHHAWYGILNILMFGATARLVMGVPGWKPKTTLAIAMALLLAVGIEGFPMIAGTVAIISILSWSFDRRHLALRGALSVGLASLLSLILLPMHVPPDHWLEVSFVQPSIIGPVMLAVAATFLFLQYLFLGAMKQRWLSAIMLTMLAAIFAMMLVQAFPEILAGGTAALSPKERKLAAAEHPEVWTMLRAAAGGIDYFSLVAPFLIAVITGILALTATSSKRRRMLISAYIGFTAVPNMLAQIYWRYIHHAQTAMCPLLLLAWQYVRSRLPYNASYSILSLAAFVMIGPLWLILLPAFNANAPITSQVLFFPAKIYTEPYACDALTIADYLNKHYSPETLINVPDWDSATFVYETRLRVDFLSNYPSNDHFIDNKIFFQTQDLNMARQIAERHKFNLVTACTSIPMPEETRRTRPYRDPSMIERLAEGDVPPWLKPVSTGIETRFRLYKVDQNALTGNTP